MKTYTECAAELESSREARTALYRYMVAASCVYARRQYPGAIADGEFEPYCVLVAGWFDESPDNASVDSYVKGIAKAMLDHPDIKKR